MGLLGPIRRVSSNGGVTATGSVRSSVSVPSVVPGIVAFSRTLYVVREPTAGNVQVKLLSVMFPTSAPSHDGVTCGEDPAGKIASRCIALYACRPLLLARRSRTYHRRAPGLCTRTWPFGPPSSMSIAIE